MNNQYLKNGARVIEQDGATVLADWNGQYVTWKIDSEGSAYWGHYYNKDLKDALSNYNERRNAS